MRRLIFWQGALSMHQSAMLRSLAASGIEVTLVVWEELEPLRRQMRWHRPNFGAVQMMMRPTVQEQADLLSGHPDAVHIFSGTRGHPMIWRALRQSRLLEDPIGIQSESYDTRGLKGMIRWLASAYDALTYAKRVDFTLGMGGLGVDWFTKSGYPARKIYPFGYFVESPMLHADRSATEALSARFFDIILVGQLIPRKGWDVLLHALSRLPRGTWRLHVVGDGQDRAALAQLGDTLCVGDYLRFYGMLPSPEAINLIAKSDLLVLPSRWDGWGAVVNEALMCGVPAVCSDRCGAAVLLDGSERGEVFRSESVSELSAVLDRWISRGKKDAATSTRIKDWSTCISGESGASYLAGVLHAAMDGGERPSPPWREGWSGIAVSEIAAHAR